MSARHFCDVCGKEYPQLTMRRYEVTVPAIRTVASTAATRDVMIAADVCPSCESDVNAALGKVFNKAAPLTPQQEFQRSAAGSHRSDRRASP